MTGVQMRRGIHSLVVVFQRMAQKRQSSADLLNLLRREIAENLGELIHGSALQFFALALELGGDSDKDHPAVRFRTGALYQSQLFQTVYYAGDGAVGASGSIGQLADGHRAVAVQNGQHDRLGICQVQLSVVKSELLGKAATNLKIVMQNVGGNTQGFQLLL